MAKKDEVKKEPEIETTDTPKVEKKETVEIEKATLDKILDTIEKQEKANEKLTKDIDMLRSVADKGRLAKYEAENNPGGLIRKAKVGMWEGSPVIGWAKVKDEVGFKDGRLQFTQIIRLFIDDGTATPVEKDMDYLYWAQNMTHQEGEVVEKNSTNNGEYWTVQMADGRKIKVDIRFIN